MRRTRTILGFTVAACFTLTPAYADHGPAPKPTTVAGKPTTNGPSTTTHKTATKSSTTTHTTNNGHSTTTSTSTSKSSTKTNGSTTTTKTNSKKTTTTTSSGGTTPPTTMNPIATKIASKPQLNKKISAMLPSNMTLDQASKDFRNQGQFIAALHAAQRCGQPNCFSLIKADMTKNGMSLGQAIQDVKKTSSSTATQEASKAEHDADDDVKSTTPPPAPKTKKPKTDGDHDADDKDHHHDGDKDRHHDEHRTIAQRISSNPQLKTKVQALLQGSTLTLAEATKGFHSESQFLAALHASKDLNIPFTQIKAEMTGNDHDSLTRAIQELKPSVNAETAAKTAQQEASADLKSTTTTTTTTTHDGE